MLNQIEFLFAHWAVPKLKDLRGARWRALVERIAVLPPTHPDALAFALLMIRVNDCVKCTPQPKWPPVWWAAQQRSWSALGRSEPAWLAPMILQVLVLSLALDPSQWRTGRLV